MSLAIIALLVVFALREYTHHTHDTRRDALISELTDKIKARDFTEYKDKTAPVQLFEPVDKSDEDQYWQEVEESKQ